MFLYGKRFCDNSLVIRELAVQCSRTRWAVSTGVVVPITAGPMHAQRGQNSHRSYDIYHDFCTRPKYSESQIAPLDPGTRYHGSNSDISISNYG